MAYISRRNFLKTTMAAGAGSVLIPKNLIAQSDQNTPEPSLKGKKVLYVWGGWDGHEPKQSVDIFVPWMRSEGAEVVVSDTLDSYLDEDLMNSRDLIIQIVTMSQITREQESGLLNAVKNNGTGIAGWHGGLNDAFRNNTDYQFMIGSQWVAHPGGVIDFRVNIVNHNDPVTEGLNDFDLHSEQYYMHVDPNVKVLATTKFIAGHAPWADGCVMPVAYKKYYGEGRVFFSSAGHVMADFEVPEVLEIMKRGIRWASESKYHAKESWVSPAY
jgi:type 1 glutamine amidotransferase